MLLLALFVKLRHGRRRFTFDLRLELLLRHRGHAQRGLALALGEAGFGGDLFPRLLREGALPRFDVSALALRGRHLLEQLPAAPDGARLDAVDHLAQRLVAGLARTRLGSFSWQNLAKRRRVPIAAVWPLV